MKSDALGRLVVTGHDSSGEAIFVSDKQIPDVELMGSEVKAHFFWGRDDVACFPDNGHAPTQTAIMPPPGGCRFASLTIAAGANAQYHAFIAAAMGDMAEKDRPGFHRTPTMDIVYVTAGEITLEVDGNAERVLVKGDSAVLNGIRHRWRNDGKEDATIIVVMIGAQIRQD